MFQFTKLLVLSLAVWQASALVGGRWVWFFYFNWLIIKKKLFSGMLLSVNSLPLLASCFQLAIKFVERPSLMQTMFWQSPTACSMPTNYYCPQTKFRFFLEQTLSTWTIQGYKFKRFMSIRITIHLRLLTTSLLFAQRQISTFPSHRFPWLELPKSLQGLVNTIY